MVSAEKIPYIKAAILSEMAKDPYSSVPQTAIQIQSRFFTDGNEFEGDLVYASEPEIDAALRELEEEDFIIGFHDPYARSRYRITTLAFNSAPNPANLTFELRDKYVELGRGWLFEVLENIVTQTKEKSLPEKTSYSFFKDQLLIALAKKEEQQGPDYNDLKDVADEFGLVYQTGWVRKAAYSFRDYGYIDEAFSLGGGEDGNLSAALTGEGLEEVERLLEHEPKRSPAPIRSSNVIPASDRTVPLNHNSAEHAAAKDAVDALVQGLKDTNDRGGFSEEEWAQHIHEIEAGRIMLEAPQVSVELMEKCLIAPIKLIIEHLPGTAAGMLATKALEALAALF